MKKCRYSLIFLFGILFLLLSCSEDDGGIVIRHITARTETGNVLRIPISVSFSEDCSFRITYWEQGHKEKAVTTPDIHTSGAQGEVTLNFLKGATDYYFQIHVIGGPSSKEYSFTTQEVPIDVPTYSLSTDNLGGRLDGYVLQWDASIPGYITFCDMQGNVVWYEKFPDAIRTAVYDPDSRSILLMTGFMDEANYYRLCSRIVRIDLDGNILLNWTPSDRTVRYPHHDFKVMPDGNLIFVNNSVREFDLRSIGGTAAHKVWGDGFTIISTDGVVQRKWDCFDTLDPIAANEYINTVKMADDFIHANSVNWDSNGDLYMTFNRLSELWKIDKSTGKVIYRVGPHGNVSLAEADMASGLHCAEPLSPDRILCFDNGKSSGHSRAIIYQVDPTAMTAKATLSVRLPQEFSSSDRSNAQFLEDKQLLFFGSTQGRASIVCDLSGNILWTLKRVGISYRSYYYPRTAF